MAAHLIHDQLVGAYVYAITVDGVTRYIGKGRAYRVLEHFRYARLLNEARARGEKVRALPAHNKIAKAMRGGCDLAYVILANGLSDDEAFDRERDEIAAAPAGQLWNVRPGGRETDPAYMRGLWLDPAFRDCCLSRQAEGRAADPEWRQKQREATQKVWNTPGYREAWMAQHRALWDDPVAAAERRALLRRAWDDPEKSARMSEIVKRQWTPERRAAMAENRRKAWADPAFKARASASIRAAKAAK